jgi:hypothetical protein
VAVLIGLSTTRPLLPQLKAVAVEDLPEGASPADVERFKGTENASW